VRLVKESPVISDTPIDTPEKIVKKFAEMLSEFDREVVGVINLKSDCTPINIHIASIGALNQAMACPREIFKAAILSNAANMILIHNHPSNNIMPSKEDTKITEQMNMACKIIGIDLLDHIIVGTDFSRYFSFKEKGIMPLSKITVNTDYKNLEIGKVAEQKKKPKKTKSR